MRTMRLATFPPLRAGSARSLPTAFAAMLALAVGGAASCAKVSTPEGGGGGSSGTGSSSGGGGRIGPGTGGRGDGTGGTFVVTMPDGGGVCQMFAYKFEPKIPTVILLVDRSGSMFDCISTTNPEPSCPSIADTTWTKLKDGILPVVMQLQSQVRFGFSTITGSNPSAGGMCPMGTPVAPEINNYDRIAALYNSLPPGPNSTQSGVKWETPTRQLLEMVGNQLSADPAPGDKYILFVTDGEPDYCGDGNTLCPPDSVVWQLQSLKKKGISTIVFGLKATSTQDLPMGVLEAFANAGAGEPTLPPLRGTNPKIEDFFDQCFSTGAPATEAPGGWTLDFRATGKPMMRGQTIGDYSTTAGPTLPYRPDVTNQQQLINQLSQALSGVKSCLFDLGKDTVTGRDISVTDDPAELGRAKVLVEGRQIPLNDTNGWRRSSATQVELIGTACSDWRKPENVNIDFQFPCGTITVD